jgi:hypothetical protein
VDEVDERLALCPHTRSPDALAELIAGQRALACEARGDRRDSAGGRVRADALLLEPAPVGGLELRRGQSVQPGVILAADQVEGAAIDRRDDQRALFAESAVDVGLGPGSRAGARRPRPDQWPAGR